MKRKLHIPKAAQIRGLRKAIANRKTPKQFIPGLKKRLAKLTACILFALAASSARAQAPVSLVPIQQTLAAAGTACTGSAQTFAVNNRNQTQHYAYVVPNASVTSMLVQIQGLDSAGNIYVISDTAGVTIPANGNNNASLQGSGYFPTVRVSVTCLPASTGTFTLNYSGGQAITNVNLGSYLISQVDKTIGSAAPAGTTFNSGVLQTPYGNSFGQIYFQFVGAGPSGSQVQLTCTTQTGLVPLVQLNFNLATTSALEQNFAVPPGPCPNMTLNYVPGGASASTYNFDFVYASPGSVIPNSYVHITGTTATVVKAGPGIVHSIVVGTSAAGTISLFDLVSGSCTGTPSTNTVSVITEFASAAPPPPFYLNDVLFNNGICVKASAGMDITVSYQ